MKYKYWLRKFKNQKPKNIDNFLVANGIVDMDFRERLTEFQNFLLKEEEEKNVNNQEKV